MKQKTDFEKFCKNNETAYDFKNNLETIRRQIEIAGFNVLSDRELEKMLELYAFEGGNAKKWLAEWKKERRKE